MTLSDYILEHLDEPLNLNELSDLINKREVEITDLLDGLLLLSIGIKVVDILSQAKGETHELK